MLLKLENSAKRFKKSQPWINQARNATVARQYFLSGVIVEERLLKLARLGGQQQKGTSWFAQELTCWPEDRKALFQVSSSR